MSNSSLIVTSTTDTPEQVKAAMEAHGYSAEPPENPEGAVEGTPQETPKPPASAEPPAKPGEAGDKTDDAPGASDDNQDPDETGQPKPKSKKGIEARFSELTRARREAERENAELQRSLDDLHRRLTEAGEKPDAPKPGTEPKPEAKLAGEAEPALDSFETYEEWVKAHQLWTAQQANAPLKAEIESLKKQIQAKDAAEAERAARQPLVDAFIEKLEKAKAAHEDFDEVTAGTDEEGLVATPAMHQEIFESDKSGEVLYYLATHPEDCRRIEELTRVPEKPTPAQVGAAVRAAAREIGRIEALLTGEPAKAPASKAPDNPKPKPHPLPAPITPVKGAAAAEKDPGKMTTEEYFRWEQSRRKSRAA